MRVEPAPRICFVSSQTAIAHDAMTRLESAYGSVSAHEADVIVALGGDGFMLSTLHATEGLDAPVYGMNRGTVGFLMNAYSEDDLLDRITAAETAEIHPLRMIATDRSGETHSALAINEVSLLRMGPQAAKLRIGIDGRERMAELVCDGALVSTPAGSTAYNYSAHGPILPIGADILALTAMSAYRPRRWRGALLPSHSEVTFDVLEPEKRGIAATADSAEVRDVVRVIIRSEPEVTHRLLFDPGHGLEERLIREQFV
ncbi:NAD kinase [Pontivivens nitratireducens]|uniref:NAD kinase n=1 Tax=Pontivivens nitratireducens TaxID=2758038 RepID=A0A6G7VKD6_9RHOB|nr:NAD kinase [Pontibrevibacter nitratireducens]QIK40257.1 NAD kinase [Pontibrevibacter nitratireducens]